MKAIKPIFRYAFLFLALGLFSCVKPQKDVRESIDLSGEWMYAFDPDNEGMMNNWSEGIFKEVIELPGIPENGAPDPVWFSRKVTIPDGWKDKCIRLMLERSKHVMVWVDGQPAGESSLMQAPQWYDLSSWLTPGEHMLTVRVDRSPSAINDPVLGSANTIMGAIKLEASSLTHITSMNIKTQLDTRSLRVRLNMANPPQQETLRIKLSMQYLLGDLTVNAASTTYRVQSDSSITLNYSIKGRMPLWNEFRQPLVRLTAEISDEDNTWNDAYSTVLGLRTFNSDGSSYVMNENTVFLRGYVESGRFLSTSSPMDKKTWIKRFEKIKQDGFNHCRFTTWCPPEAAFSAADKCGIYMQVDMPASVQNDYAAIKTILAEYGHHPSFVLFSSGSTNWKQVSVNARQLTAPLNSLSIASYPFYSAKKTADANDKERSEASKQLAALCYRADIEAAFKTQGLSGYQLSEYPAVVNDEVIGWHQFNSEVVPLLTFDKHCWFQSETFAATVDVANYSNKALTAAVKWTVSMPDGETVKSGTVSKASIKNGRMSSVGAIKFSLSSFNKPVRLNLSVMLDSSDYRNDYPIWVYPATAPIGSKKVFISSLLNKAVMNELEAGGRVLLIPTIRSIYTNSLAGSFAPVAQQADATAPGTLGLFIQSKHPALADFPTEFYSNWQWMTIVNASRALNLSALDSTYKPIVQVIDPSKRNRMLGMICEFKVGAGRLLICTSKLYEIKDKPEAVQLNNSLVRYAESEAFKPTYPLSPEMLKRLISYTVTSVR